MVNRSGTIHPSMCRPRSSRAAISAGWTPARGQAAIRNRDHCFTAASPRYVSHCGRFEVQSRRRLARLLAKKAAIGTMSVGRRIREGLSKRMKTAVSGY
jgi:hypothetical protein